MFADVIVDIEHEKLDKIFQYRIPERLKDELSLEKAASLGSSDRHGSCLFLADPRGFRLDPAVYRCHDSMECRLCDTGTA